MRGLVQGNDEGWVWAMRGLGQGNERAGLGQ